MQDLQLHRSGFQKQSLIMYEIEFYVNGVEYEYEIDAVTGEIISFESEIDD